MFERIQKWPTLLPLQDFYAPGSYIIRQGAIGDSFYILRSGKVKVTKKIPGELCINDYASLSVSLGLDCNLGPCNQIYNLGWDRSIGVEYDSRSFRMLKFSHWKAVACDLFLIKLTWAWAVT